MPHDVDSTVFFFRPLPDRRQQPERRAQWRGGRRGDDFSPAMREGAARIIGEYTDQPGLALSLDHAAHLFSMDVNACAGLLLMLTERGVLTRTLNGHFVMLPGAAHPVRVANRPRGTAEDRRPA